MKIFAAVLLALIFTFLFLVGLKINYLDRYGVEIYFNAFFSSNQPYSLLLFFLPSLAAFYLPKKGGIALLVALFLVSVSTFAAGEKIGKKLYMATATYTIGQHTTPPVRLIYSYRGTDYVLFKGRSNVKTYKSEYKNP